MEDETLIINTLKSLQHDLRVERFHLSKVKKAEKAIKKLQSASLTRIKEIKNRMNYNIREHTKLFKKQD